MGFTTLIGLAKNLTVGTEIKKTMLSFPYASNYERNKVE